jgi:nucleoside triphosphate diphosphatase
VPLNLPALARAQKIQKRAGRVGFDWRDPAPALEKVVEETAEVRAALADGEPG